MTCLGYSRAQLKTLSSLLKFISEWVATTRVCHRYSRISFGESGKVLHIIHIDQYFISQRTMLFRRSCKYVKTYGDVFLKIDVINFLFEHLRASFVGFLCGYRRRRVKDVKLTSTGVLAILKSKCNNRFFFWEGYNVSEMYVQKPGTFIPGKEILRLSVTGPRGRLNLSYFTLLSIYFVKVVKYFCLFTQTTSYKSST